MVIFLTFSTIYANVGLVGGSEKVQKCADVINGWSSYICCKVELAGNAHRLHRDIMGPKFL